MPDDDMEMIGARIPADLNNSLEQYCDDLSIRKSEGVRRLLQDSIRENRTEPVAISLGAVFAVTGLGMIIGAFINPASLAARTGVLLLVLGTLIELFPRLKSTITERF